MTTSIGFVTPAVRLATSTQPGCTGAPYYGTWITTPINYCQLKYQSGFCAAVPSNQTIAPYYAACQ
jgi:hypothetical protein